MKASWLVTKQMFNLRALNETSVAYEVAKEINDSQAMNFILFFKTLSNIYFFCFVVYMLFYVGAMKWLVDQIGRVLQVRSVFLRYIQKNQGELVIG